MTAAPKLASISSGGYSFYMSTFLVTITAIHLTKALVIGYRADGDMAGATLYATFAPSEIKASVILRLSFILLPLIGLYVIVDKRSKKREQAAREQEAARIVAARF